MKLTVVQPAYRQQAAKDLMSADHVSFEDAVIKKLKKRDLTKDDVRAIVAEGLEETCGNYKRFLETCNVWGQKAYKRVMHALRQYECHVDQKQFRVPRNVVQPATPAA